MRYEMGIFLRQSWKDERLSFRNLDKSNKSITFDHELIDKIWIPGINTYYLS